MNIGEIYTYMTAHFWRKVDNIDLRRGQYIKVPNDLSYVTIGAEGFAGLFRLSDETATIASGVATVTAPIMNLTSESGSTDDLIRLLPSDVTRTIVLIQPTPAHTITVKHGAMNIVTQSGSDVALAGVTNWMILYKRSAAGYWYEIASYT